MKHHKVKQMFPHVTSIIGDISDYTLLKNAMIDKDVVLHLAAQKHIPDSERDTIDTIRTNLLGTLAVADIALELGTPHVMCISTDKSAHPANAYGATKYLCEKVFQEYSRIANAAKLPTRFHLVRYGNVLESTGSVIEVWKNQVERGEPIKITDPQMTRFFISPSQAVNLVLDGLKLASGMILIPKMKSLSIEKLAEYTVGKDVPFEIVSMRPGEKIHEMLLTEEEVEFAIENDNYFFLKPTTEERMDPPWCDQYSSDIAPELTKDELEALLQDS